MFHQLIVWIADTVGQFGYLGIVLLMALESSFFPFPSEIVIPPAAYLAANGKMNIGIVILCSTFGSLVGAIFNYWLALKFGRSFFQKHGKYLFLNPKSLEKADLFFERHGRISTFIGRLVPVIRQYISLPAGLARMNLTVFCSATALGAGIWVVVLAAMGFWFGRNEQLIFEQMRWISLILTVSAGIIGIFYWRWHKKKNSGTS